MTEVGFQNETAPITPSGGELAFGTGEQEAGIRPSRWGKFVEMVRQTSFDSPLGFMPGYEGAWSRALVQNLLESDAEKRGGTKITAEEANKRYPGLPKPFDEPVYPEIADIIYNDHKRRQKMQAWVDRGPETGWGTKLGAMASTALDPVNLALNFSLARVLKFFKVKQTIPVIYGENLAGNLAADVPSYFQLKRERQDPSVVDLAVGSAAGAALGTGIAKAFDAIGNFLSKTPDNVKARVLKEQIDKLERGENVDTRVSTATTALRGAGVARGTQNPYSWQELSHPSERMFYEAVGAESAEAVPQGRYFGPGRQLGDDGVKANNLAADPESPFSGRVRQYEVSSDSKFLNLEDAVDTPHGRQFVDSIEKKFEIETDLPPGAKLVHVFDEIEARVAEGSLPESALEEVVGAAKELGYHGYRYVDETVGDARSNGLVLFDESRAQLREEFTANKAIAPTMEDGEVLVRAVNEEAPRFRHESPEIDEKIQALKSSKPAEPTDDGLEPVIKDQEARAKRELQELAEEDPSIKDEVDAIRAEEARSKQEAQVLRDFAECYLKGMI